MSAAPFTRRIPRRVINTLTFDGTTIGDVGTDTIFTVTGRVLITHMSIFCKTTLVGASATIALGTASNTAGLVALTTAANILVNTFWQDTTPETKISPAIVNQNVSGNIIATTATAAITAGVLEFVAFYLPCSDDGFMV